MLTTTTGTEGLGEVFQLARALKQASGFLPPHLRTEGEIVAVVLAGKELGLPPMVSLRSIHLIKGKVVLAADVQLGLMRAAGVKVRWLKDGSDGTAELELRRDGDAPHVSRFTLDMAKTAGLLANDTWRKHPAAMLRARCVSAAGKAFMPDVLAGCYVPGELDDDPAQAAPPVLTVVPQLPAPDAQEGPQAPRQGPVPPPEPHGPPPDAPAPHTGEELAAVREMHRQKLLACQSREELCAWLKALEQHAYPKVAKKALWGMFRQHAESLGHDPKSFAPTKGGK